MKNNKLLFLLQVPPPIHGQSLRNLSLVNSKLLNENFTIKLLPLNFAKSISDIGSVNFYKILKVLSYAFNLTANILISRPAASYFTIAPTGGAFIRDCLFVAILKVFNVKRIYHLRGLGIKQEMINSRAKSILYKWAFKGAFVVCLSEGHKVDIELLTCKKIFVVPNGIEYEALSQSTHQKLEHSKKLLFFSNLIVSKGVLVFVDAIKILVNKGYKVTGIIAGANGDITNEDVAKYIKQQGVEANIELLKSHFGKEKFELFESADIFVFPTYHELFPGVILEAMQCELPIVSTNTGAISEIIDHNVNGLLATKKNNAESIVELVEIYLNNPTIANEHASNAKKKYIQTFTMELFENNMKEMYLSVLGTD
jgi:glycosyltransferase involved in cell wall biosynthesis